VAGKLKGERGGAGNVAGPVPRADSSAQGAQRRHGQGTFANPSAHGTLRPGHGKDTFANPSAHDALRAGHVENRCANCMDAASQLRVRRHPHMEI
jgi:hypothetical protein